MKTDGFENDSAIALNKIGSYVSGTSNKDGGVAILKTDGTLVALIEAGCQPDMVTFTPDGSKILVANEGEPREGFGEGIVDPKGSVTIGTVDGKTYAFIALERIGGIMMYDITNPESAKYVNYINTRDFSESTDDADPKNPDSALTGDVAPEGMYFISADASPSKTPILLAAFEVSGTVSAYSVMPAWMVAVLAGAIASGILIFEKRKTVR